MKLLLMIAFAAGALAAAPALAQDHAARDPDASAAAPADTANMTPEQMHEYCKGVMGQEMKGRVPHEHTAEKLGHAPPPPKPPSEAEMKKMHEKCAAMMAQDKKPAPPPKP